MKTIEELESEAIKLNKKIDLLTQAVKQSRTIKLKFNESTKLLKARDKELLDFNNSLEQKIQEAIDENRQKDQILNHQSKMASMGEMIGNIAHQWRQPLSVISTAASGIQVQKEYDVLTDEILNTSLESILKSTSFLSQTIDDFRNFFATNKEKHIFPLGRPALKAISLVGSAFSNNSIEVITDLDDNFMVNGYENEVIQAVINIINNSKDALKEKIADNGKRVIFIDMSKDDEYVVLKIKDNAGGIPTDIISKVFEPYFTTKHKSKGTGIGLYMTNEIVVKHFLGVLEVVNQTYLYENIEYTGAEFTIKIALAE